MLLEEQLAKIQQGIDQAGPYSPIGRIMTVRQAELESEIAQVHEERNEAIRSLLSEEMSRSTANPEITGRPVTAPKQQRGRWESQDVHSPEEAFGQQSSESSQTEPAPQQTSLPPQPLKKINPQGLRAKLDRGPRGQGGYISADILREIADYGRQIFRRGMEYFDWAMRMLADLGEQVVPYLKEVFDNLVESAENLRRSAAVHANSAQMPDGDDPDYAIFREILWKEVDSTRNLFQRIGVRIVYDNDVDQVGVKFTNADDIVLQIPPNVAAEHEAAGVWGKMSAGHATRLMLGEELIHAIYLRILREKWRSEGSLGTFPDFVKQNAESLFDGIRRFVEKSPESSELKKVLRASYHAYFNPHGQTLDRGTSITNLFKELEGDRNMPIFIAEFVRQVVQLNNQGRLTEEVSLGLYEIFKDFLKRLMEMVGLMRTRLPDVYRGDFGPEIKETVEKMDNEISALFEVWPIGAVGQTGDKEK